MLYQETLPQNSSYTRKHTNTRQLTDTDISVATLHLIVPAKTEITISSRQLSELTKLYADSFSNKPGWLRQKFYLNQRRKKQLNILLYESGLDGNWCGYSCDMNDWAGMLHVVWHYINGKRLCK